MTSASELFYQRRSPFGRDSEPFISGSDFGSHPPPDRINRRHRHHNGAGGNHARLNRLDSDGCEPLRRAVQHSRLIPHYRPSQPPQERESILHEEGGHHYSSGNSSHSETQVNVGDRLILSGNDRLPGPVLLARERLLERLRGVTLSGRRRSNRSSSSSHHDFSIGDDFRLVDAGDWETEISREWLAAIIPATNSIGQHPSKRPPGLTQEAVSRLPVEVFCVAEDRGGRNMLRASRECSICLESFSEGDELIRLPCKHRYHFCCLDPWVRTCGDCPYCRGDVNVTLDGVKDNPEC